MSSTHRECLRSSRWTFIARESIVRVEHGRLEAGGNEKNERERKRARKIYTEDNISEQYFAGRSATQGDKEGERKRERDASGLFLAREDAPHSRGLKNVLLLIYTPFQKLRMHKHRLAQAGLFSHLPPCLYKDTFCHDPKIQNQRGILLTIYVGISSTLYPGIRQGCLCNERYIIARKKSDQSFLFKYD